MFKLNTIFSTLLRAKACLRSGLTPLESPLSLSSIWSSSFSRMSKPPRQIKTKINDTKANELKSNIKESSEAERYVSMKHENQATTRLRKLNKDIESKQSENKRLTNENVALQYSQSRHNVYAGSLLSV